MDILNRKTGIGLISIVILILAIGAFTNMRTSGGLSDITGDIMGITTYVESDIQVTREPYSLPVKIILEKIEAVGNALFDIILTIPGKSRGAISSEDLLISIELINFGEPGKTNVSIAYIITNSKGDVVLIEHEKRVVETQTSYLKTIDLPDLESGYYILFVELLYSNTSAIATEEFTIIS